MNAAEAHVPRRKSTLKGTVRKSIAATVFGGMAKESKVGG